MTDDIEAFRDAISRSDRVIWYDGIGSRQWSGQRGLVFELKPEDVSLTFERGVVWKHQNREREAIGDDIFQVLSDEIAKEEGQSGKAWIGYFGYAARNDLPGRRSHTVPDAMWMKVNSWDEYLHREVDELRLPTSIPDGTIPAAYRAAYDEVQRQLREGNTYEVNLTYREQIVSNKDPVSAYMRLRQLNPAPYAGFIRHGSTDILMSSPERFARIDLDRMIETRPIKGTTPRGATEAEDLQARVALLSEERYRAENLMITDLLRNDLGMVCEPGSVVVPQLMEVESFASVHQLVTTIRGTLREGVRSIDAIKSIFPPGSMTGSPKLRTMEIIDQIESTPRGVYAGVAGWISCDGEVDLGVVIRSMVATPVGGHWLYEYGTGGGITVHSTLESEYAESRWKAERLLLALAD